MPGEVPWVIARVDFELGLHRDVSRAILPISVRTIKDRPFVFKDYRTPPFVTDRSKPRRTTTSVLLGLQPSEELSGSRGSMPERTGEVLPTSQPVGRIRSQGIQVPLIAYCVAKGTVLPDIGVSVGSGTHEGNVKGLV